MKTLALYYDKNTGQEQNLVPCDGPLLARTALIFGKYCEAIKPLARYLEIPEVEYNARCLQGKRTDSDNASKLLSQFNIKHSVLNLATNFAFGDFYAAGKALDAIRFEKLPADHSFGDKTLADLYPDTSSLIKLNLDNDSLAYLKNPICFGLLLGFDKDSLSDMENIRSRSLGIEGLPRVWVGTFSRGSISVVVHVQPSLADVIPVLCDALDKTDNPGLSAYLKQKARECAPVSSPPIPGIFYPPPSPDPIRSLWNADLKKYLADNLECYSRIWPICLGIKWADVERMSLRQYRDPPQERFDIIRHWRNQTEKPLQQYLTGNATIDLSILSKIFGHSCFTFSDNPRESVRVYIDEYVKHIISNIGEQEPKPEPSEFHLVLLAQKCNWSMLKNNIPHFHVTSADHRVVSENWRSDTLAYSYALLKAALKGEGLKRAEQYKRYGLSNSEALIAAAITSRHISTAEEIARIMGYSMERVVALKKLYE